MKADKAKEPNMDELRAQIRQEIMEELKNNSLQTQSIISSSDQTNSVKEEVQLSAQEMRVARGLGMSPSEYAKWAR
jgi:phage I-like protein